MYQHKTLYQKTSIGRVMRWAITQESNTLTYEWGYIGSENQQLQTENVQATSRTTNIEQASLIFDRKVKTRKQNGFKDSEQEAQMVDAKSDFTFDPFPSAFAPAKPIAVKPTENPDDDPKEHRPNKAMKDLMAAGKLIAQRKANGVRCFYVRFEDKPDTVNDMFDESEGITQTNSKIFTRKIKDCSGHFESLKIHLDSLPIPANTILDIEVTLGGGFTDEQFIIVNSMTPNTKPAEANRIYNQWLKDNPNKPLIGFLFDIIFWDGENIYQLPYEDRLTYMESVYRMNGENLHDYQGDVNKTEAIWLPQSIEISDIEDFNDIVAIMIKQDWEGLVLKDISASCEFWLNGKPKRPKGNWKWKNVKEEDCFIIEVLPEKGDDSRVGSLALGQFLSDGTLLHCGNAGSGLTDNDAYSAWDWVGRVIKIQYDYRLPKNSSGEICFRNPRIIGLHKDKTKHECIFEKEI